MPRLGQLNASHTFRTRSKAQVQTEFDPIVNRFRADFSLTEQESPKMTEATPRITAPYLEQFSHQTVRILGRVRQLRGEQATIDAGGQISVFLNRVKPTFSMSFVYFVLIKRRTHISNSITQSRSSEGCRMT